MSRNIETVETVERKPELREGQIIMVRGKQCAIARVHPFGTVDAVNLVTGKAYRVTGLNWKA